MKIYFDRVMRATEKAVQFQFEDKLYHWIPISKIKNIGELDMEDENGIIDIPFWLAKDKGLEIYEQEP